MIQRRIINTFVQIFIWGGLWTLSTYIMSLGMPFYSNFGSRALTAILFITITVAVNLNILLPILYFKNRKILYVLSGFGLFLFLGLIAYWDWLPQNDFEHLNENADLHFKKIADILQENGLDFNSRRPQSGGIREWLRPLPSFILSFFGSTSIELSKYAQQKEKEAIELEKETLVTEIKFLKAQINPHFLFNALNNIYTLTLTKSDFAPEHLLRLSDMLRYMVYDCNADKVLLSKEVEYLNNYIELAKLKDSGGLNIQVDLADINPNLMVPPLLFIPFVENAFKHSNIEDLERGWVTIKMQTVGNSLHFNIQNSLSNTSFIKDSVGGIGINNVRKRLNLLDKNNYTLDIKKENDQYSVNLEMYNSKR